jgi:AcrR family transcriptional regulator
MTAGAVRNWGGDAPPVDEDDARGRIIDAAEACFEHFGVVKTTVEDIATEARVARQTVYRYFANRDEIVLAVTMREFEAIADKALAILRKRRPFADAAVDLVVYTLRLIHRSRYLRPLYSEDAVGLTGRAAINSMPFYEFCHDQIQPYLIEAQRRGELRTDVDTREISEWLLRVTFLHASSDGPVVRDDRELKRFLRTWLRPALIPQETSTQ